MRTFCLAKESKDVKLGDINSIIFRRMQDERSSSI